VANWDPHDFSLSEAGYLAQTNAPIVDGVAAVDLFCRDYGGSCTVSVELKGANGLHLARTFHVPVDADGDNLADRWESLEVDRWNHRFGAGAPADTAFFDQGLPNEPEDPDGNGTILSHAAPGDGIDHVQEYRGFTAHGLPGNAQSVHFRLSPATKEMLVEVDLTDDMETPGAMLGVVESAMDDVAEACLTNAGFRVVWFLHNTAYRLAPDHDQEALRSKVRLRSGDAPLPALGTTWYTRNAVFANDPFLDNVTRMGSTERCGGTMIVAAGAIRGFTEGARPHYLASFLSHHQISFREALANIAFHELGHLAGCNGDNRVVHPEPAMRLRCVPPHGGGQDILAELGNDNGTLSLMLAGEGPGGPPSSVPLLGPQVHLTLAQASSAIALVPGYQAEVLPPHLGVHSERLVPVRRSLPGNGDWVYLPVEAELEAAMAYNNFAERRYRSLVFFSGSVDSTEREALYRESVGSMNLNYR
jgi:hypothetical protein